MEKINIYIDHTLADEKLAYTIQQILITDLNCTVQHYSQVKESFVENWESMVPRILSQADIVLIIVSKNYLENFLTSEINEMINSILDSGDRFVFPIIVEKFGGAKPAWLAKSKSIEIADDISIETSFNELKAIISSITKIKLYFSHKIESLKQKHSKRISELEDEIRKIAEDKSDAHDQIASFKASLIDFLAQNKIEETIQRLKEFDRIKRNGELQKELINCSSRFHRLKGRIRSGTLSQDEIFIESNKINEGLFDIIHSMNE